MLTRVNMRMNLMVLLLTGFVTFYFIGCGGGGNNETGGIIPNSSPHNFPTSVPTEIIFPTNTPFTILTPTPYPSPPLPPSTFSPATPSPTPVPIITPTPAEPLFLYRYNVLSEGIYICKARVEYTDDGTPYLYVLETSAGEIVQYGPYLNLPLSKGFFVYFIICNFTYTGNDNLCMVETIEKNTTNQHYIYLTGASFGSTNRFRVFYFYISYDPPRPATELEIRIVPTGIAPLGVIEVGVVSRFSDIPSDPFSVYTENPVQTPTETPTFTPTPTKTPTPIPTKTPTPTVTNTPDYPSPPPPPSI